MPDAICLFTARLNVRLKWRSDSGTGLADAGVLVLGGDDILLALGLDTRQRQFFAENICEFLEGQIDFEDMAAGLVSGARGLPSPCGGQRLRRGRRRPGRRRRNSCCRSGTAGISIDGSGMLTKSRPFLPIISPRAMYLERLLLTLPRTILRKR